MKLSIYNYTEQQERRAGELHGELRELYKELMENHGHADQESSEKCMENSENYR